MSPEEYYRTIFVKSHDIILIADMDGHILEVNPAATQLYCYTQEELKNLPPGALMVPDARALMRDRIEQVRTREMRLSKPHTLARTAASSTWRPLAPRKAETAESAVSHPAPEGPGGIPNRNTTLA